MPLKIFKLSELPNLDFGLLDAAFETELKRVVADCQDRPMDDRSRQVGIIFTVSPVAGAAGMSNGGVVTCDQVAIEVEVTSKVPTRRSKPYVMQTKHDNSLMFDEQSPDDPKQLTMDETTEERMRRRRDEQRQSEPNATQRAIDQGNNPKNNGGGPVLPS